MLDCGSLIDYFKEATIRDLSHWNGIVPSVVEELVVCDNACNDTTAISVSSFEKLKTLKVGDNSFVKVEVLKLIGMKALENVTIGDYCFKGKNHSNNPDRRFCVKDCEQLKQLLIGYESFSDCSVCEVENLPSLVTLSVGKRNFYSGNFSYASLELKSASQ